MVGLGRALGVGTLAFGLMTGFGSVADAAADRGATVRHAGKPNQIARPAPVRAPLAGDRRGRHRAVVASSGGGISCVPYARMVTGMQVSGNGGHWWHNAAGLYARGQRPEPGSVMAFPGSGGMGRGHVAVVSRVLGPRHVQIDHANWGGPGIRRGSVMHGVNVVDVSDRNDWSAVRVQVGYDGDSFGRTYPLHGFIYNRPDHDAGSTAFAGLRLDGGRRAGGFEQVAELPSLSRAAAASVQTGPARRTGRGR